jgi:glycosyltransferase involved in cell wall biosynthesis
MRLLAVILTYNESKHLGRCLESLKGLATDLVVVDSFSIDDTLKIAEDYGARILQNKFINHALQFNWALERLSGFDGWVFRIDADEYVTEPLCCQIKDCLSGESSHFFGIKCNRRMTFQGRLIKHGGVFPIQVLRIFRYGFGESEDRWMDEHIRVSGETISLPGEIIDDNLNSLTWWTEKHNGYASREAIELLNLKYKFMVSDNAAEFKIGGRTAIKRWLKEAVYSKIPLGVRAFIYFFYRYVVRFGFLDGKEGAMFHFFQALWYRSLVDAKYAEIERFIRDEKVDVREAIHRCFGIRV